MVHHRIQLAADLKIQLRDMVVDQRFVELFHLLAGFTDTVHKDLHRSRQALARRRICQRSIVQKRINIPEAGRRGEVNFFKQGGVNALFFQYGGLPLSRTRFSIYRHQHIPG